MKENTEKERSIEINGVTYYHGDSIVGTIDRISTVGALYISKGNRKTLYFCQNEMCGNSTPDGNNLGYKFGWNFIVENDNTNNYVNMKKVEFVEREVSIFSEINSKTRNGNKVLQFEMFLQRRVHIKKEQKTFESVDSDSILLFRYESHPDCCGTKIAFNFHDYDETNFKEKDYEALRRKLFIIKTPILAHLASYQENAINFVKKVGFKSLHTYKNPNSSYDITLYQYDSADLN